MGVSFVVRCLWRMEDGGLERPSGHIPLESLSRPIKKHDGLAKILTLDVATQYLAYNTWKSGFQATYG